MYKNTYLYIDISYYIFGYHEMMIILVSNKFDQFFGERFDGTNGVVVRVKFNTFSYLLSELCHFIFMEWNRPFLSRVLRQL